MERGFVPIHHIVDIQNFFFLAENMSCLMVAAAVGPAGKRWRGSGTSSDVWTPGSSGVDRSPAPSGANSSGSPGWDHEKRGFVCVCGLWDTRNSRPSCSEDTKDLPPWTSWALTRRKPRKGLRIALCRQGSEWDSIYRLTLTSKENDTNNSWNPVNYITNNRMDSLH